MERRGFMVGLLSFLGFGVSAKAKSTMSYHFELSEKKRYLIGFVGQFNVPVGSQIEVDDDSVILIDVSELDAIIRLSSVTGKTKDSTILDPKSILEPIAAPTLYESVGSDRAFVVEAPKKISDGNVWFFSARLVHHNSVVVSSITFQNSSAEVDPDFVVSVLKKLNDSIVFSIDGVKALRGAGNHFDSDVQMDREKFNEADVKTLLAMRTQALRLVAESEAEYPINTNALDKLFRKIVLDPDQYNGLDAAKPPLGIAFGDYLVSHYGFRWTMIEDDFGRDFAVVRDSIKIFPVSLVSKRDRIEQVGFFSDIERRLIQSLPNPN